MAKLDSNEEVTAAIAQFPAEFGLRAYPGKRFRISQSASYVSDALGIQLYTLVNSGGVWQEFCKGTPAELRVEMVR